jgi:hypothetical protein
MHKITWVYDGPPRRRIMIPTRLQGQTMRKVLLAAVIAMWMATPVEAADTADVIAVAHQWTEAFNRGGLDSDGAPCASDAVVIDDLRPHVWQGPGACSKWYKAVMSWAAHAGVTGPTIKLGGTRHLDVGSGYAYLVAPVTLSYLKSARPVDFLGIMTMTLHKGKNGWRVSGMAWADR